MRPVLRRTLRPRDASMKTSSFLSEPPLIRKRSVWPTHASRLDNFLQPQKDHGNRSGDNTQEPGSPRTGSPSEYKLNHGSIRFLFYVVEYTARLDDLGIVLLRSGSCTRIMLRDYEAGIKRESGGTGLEKLDALLRSKWYLCKWSNSVELHGHHERSSAWQFTLANCGDAVSRIVTVFVGIGHATRDSLGAVYRAK